MFLVLIVNQILECKNTKNINTKVDGGEILLFEDDVVHIVDYKLVVIITINNDEKKQSPITMAYP
jgi:hypothetical protein